MASVFGQRPNFYLVFSLRLRPNVKMHLRSFTVFSAMILLSSVFAKNKTLILFSRRVVIRIFQKFLSEKTDDQGTHQEFWLVKAANFAYFFPFTFRVSMQFLPPWLEYFYPTFLKSSLKIHLSKLMLTRIKLKYVRLFYFGHKEYTTYLQTKITLA